MKETEGCRAKAQEAGEGRRTGATWLLASIVMMVVFGLGLMLYPFLADAYNRENASSSISGYDRAVAERTEEERMALWAQAELCNRELAERQLARGGTIDFWDITAEQEASYQQTLAVDDDGVMGYVSIQKIGVYLPIRHGIGERALQMGAGHLEGSSLPVGGASTHCVLTGHTGLPSARLFTDLSMLEEGDTFQLAVLGRTLTYEVSDIQVVLPGDVESLQLKEGEDLCTLLTCTPYGINDHRLLVTGHRVANPPADDSLQGRGVIDVKVVLGVVLAGVVAVSGGYLVRDRRQHAGHFR